MLTDAIEKQNLAAVNKLNQRGGRMLSIIDLLNDGTLDRDIAGFLLYTMFKDCSFLTAANPSGTGKTTLMGSLLNLLPPGVEIKTLNRNFNPDNFDFDKNLRFLVHELGDGPYYSYIWGKAVNKFFKLTEKAEIASCMHADTLEEMKNIFFNSPLAVKEKYFYNLDLVLFMRMQGNFYDRKRRVFSIYGNIGKKMIKLFQWQESSDSFKKVNYEKYLNYLAEKHKLKRQDIFSIIKENRDFIAEMEDKSINKMEELREQVITYYHDSFSKNLF